MIRNSSAVPMYYSVITPPPSEFSESFQSNVTKPLLKHFRAKSHGVRPKSSTVRKLSNNLPPRRNSLTHFTSSHSNMFFGSPLAESDSSSMPSSPLMNMSSVPSSPMMHISSAPSSPMYLLESNLDQSYFPPTRSSSTLPKEEVDRLLQIAVSRRDREMFHHQLHFNKNDDHADPNIFGNLQYPIALAAETDGRKPSHPTSRRGRPSPADKKPRDFSCTVIGCEMKFMRRQDLKRHVLTHTGAKPHSCPLGCGVTFSRTDAAARHVKAGRCLWWAVEKNRSRLLWVTKLL